MPTRTSGAVHYDPHERIRVEVRHHDGGWYPGWLHAWWRTSGGWRASVTYHVGAGLQHYLDVPADHVRPLDESDHGTQNVRHQQERNPDGGVEEEPGPGHTP